MKAILLDGSKENDRSGERIRAVLEAELKTRGWDIEHFNLCEQKIGNCAGDFFCWIRTPGVCNVNDDNRLIAEVLATCDLLVYLTPITFGGYSATLKRMVDHQIQNVSPFFAMIEGETHHVKRYKKNPDLLAVGWMTAPDTQAESIFRHLVHRNAINFHTQTYVSGVVLAGQSDTELHASAQKWVDDLQRGRSSARVDLPISRATARGSVEMRRALLLVGSPKTRKSTSNLLGAYLFEGLGAHIQTETIYLHTVLRSSEKMQALLDAVDAADLVTLVFPLYVDTLPAPVIEALERITLHRKGHAQTHRQLFAAIANCGFPEAFQCNTALANCERFSQGAGFTWAGGMALGAGHMLDGVPSLAEGGGMTMMMRQNLEQAAKALAQGQAIPQAARDGLAKPVIPHWLYRLSGWWRWIQKAKANDARKLLKRQPYLANVK